MVTVRSGSALRFMVTSTELPSGTEKSDPPKDSRTDVSGWAMASSSSVMFTVASLVLPSDTPAGKGPAEPQLHALPVVVHAVLGRREGE